MASYGKSVPILGGRAALYPPTEAVPRYRVSVRDRMTGKTLIRSGGRTEESAIQKARDLLGDFTPGHKVANVTPPTFSEVLDDWIDSNRTKWSSRTVDNYLYLANRIQTPIGEEFITSITPDQLALVDTQGLSRNQQLKLRSLVRGVFTHASAWIKHDSEVYASRVKVTGTRADRTSEHVEKGDVPQASYVSLCINIASSTFQLHPAWRDEEEMAGWSFNELTGEITPAWERPRWGFSYEDDERLGLPLETLNNYRRGMPNHYKNREQRRLNETQELASKFRELALMMAIGAGGGLRIGEVFALRVRHVLPDTQEFRKTIGMFMHMHREQPNLMKWLGYRGAVEVVEQASQASKGRIVLSPPKYNSERTVYLPAFLYRPHIDSVDLTRTRREQILTVPGMERFQDPSVSLWQATDDECMQLWRAGFIPLGWMLVERLREMWLQLHRSSEQTPRYQDFQNLLLFPTRNKARKNSHLEVPESWRHYSGIVDGFGSYQQQSNFALRWSNPVYDYASQLTGHYPAHRTNSTKRKGWTHHGLRHYAATSMLLHRTFLPNVSKQLGHRDPQFTVRRYSHAIDMGYDELGFE